MSVFIVHGIIAVNLNSILEHSIVVVTNPYHILILLILNEVCIQIPHCCVSFGYIQFYDHAENDAGSLKCILKLHNWCILNWLHGVRRLSQHKHYNLELV
jgi:hypothetical protein